MDSPNHWNGTGIPADDSAEIAVYSQAIALNPQHALAYKNRGCAKIKMGEYSDAKQDIEHAIDLAPDNFTFLCSMAEVLIFQGQYDEAFGWMERALAVDQASRALLLFRTSADYDPLRSDPRFTALVED